VLVYAVPRFGYYHIYKPLQEGRPAGRGDPNATPSRPLPRHGRQPTGSQPEAKE
jgi:hypothetical protein